MARFLSLIALFSSTTTVGCSDDGVSVIVDLKTDLVPGVEFSRVETAIVDEPALGAPVTVRTAQELSVELAQPFIDGRRVAEFSGVPEATTLLRVRLFDARGRETTERFTRVAVAGDTAVTVLLTRNCVDVTCPSDESATGLQACLDGACVDERCSPETQEFCPDAVCSPATVDTDCPMRADCATATCDDGVCLYGSAASACDSDEWCNPEVGCESIPVIGGDAGNDGGVDGGDAEMDTGPAGECDEQPAGAACGASGQVCDGRGGCQDVLAGVRSIDVGWEHACAVMSDRRVVCWGNNDQGQLGPNTLVVHNRPVYVPGVADVEQIATGWYFTCARHVDGTLSCWGDNVEGQLGDGTTRNDRPAVEQVAGIDDAILVDAGANMTCVIHAGGTLSCWGWNRAGQLGDGSGMSQYTPADVSLPTTVVDVDTIGDGHTCALATDGRVFCWGDNDYGQLGTEMSPTTTPTVPVLDVSDAVAIDTTEDGTCATRMGGQVMCWGRNALSRFTAAGPELQTRPTATSFPMASALQMSRSMTCVTPLAGGAPVCVGEDGRPGDGSVGAMTPVAVSSPAADFRALVLEGNSGSGTVACGIRSGDDSVYCWGANGVGQLGDGTLTQRLQPVPVLPPTP